MLKRCIITIFAICLYVAASADTFSHYVGHANQSFDSHGMQRVSEVHYYYFVHDNGQSFAISLPLMNYSSSGNDTEPRNYFRWYDYNTDRSSPNLVKNGKYLEEVYDKDGISRGLIAYNLPSKSKNNSEIRPSQSTVGVTYVPPAGATDESWEGETIACDVSRYNDFGGVGGEMNAEPTLSLRFIIHIQPARRLARNIINAVATDAKTEHSDVTLEDNGRIVFGAKDGNSTLTLRTEYAPSHYFFYPLTNYAKKHAYPTTDEHNIKSSDFNMTTMYQANCIQWRVYDQTKTKYTILTSAGTQMMWFTSMNMVLNNRNGWKDLNGKSTSKPEIKYGDELYYVAYAAVKGTQNVAPIANFNVLYQSTYPKTREEVIADGDNERMVTYLNEHYQQAMKPISFDDDNDELDLSAPTTPDNNMSRLPSKWDKRSYGFVYRELKNFTPSSTTPRKWWLPYTPVHGEYGLYKSANLKGVSDVASGYVWWHTGNVVYDRTYEHTGGKQYGHFLYIDASDESRQIAVADFKANLCSGARLIFSGAVSDFTGSTGTQPEVMFKLYGVIRNENDNIIYQKHIISFSSGDFSTNIKKRQLGKWHQVYACTILPRNTGAENYSDFRIVMDNMCKSTAGADYLIDDLRLYIQPAKVDVVQNTPVCPNEAERKDIPNHVTLKLRAYYDNMLAMVGNKASHIFYRICDTNGTPVSNIDYDGDRQSDAYGTAEIPASYDTAKMLPKAAADGKDNVPMFETDPQNNTIILFANRYFNLPLGKQFYISVAYPSEDDETQPDTWGVPTNVCSTYSTEFEIVKQGIVITDANGNVVTTLRVSCDTDRTPNVKISAKLETADVVNGGKVTLNNVKFDWFLGKPGEENRFTEIEGLEEALDKYRNSYPDATELKAEYAAVDADGYALLKKYTDNGQLVIAASNNLNNYKFGKDMLGTIKIAAIPIATTITEGKTTYEICPDPMYFSLRIVEDGPKLTLGFHNVVYPNDERTVRIGLPQIRSMLAKDKCLILPVASLESSKSIAFNNDSHVFIANTNDPTFSNDRQIVGSIQTKNVTTASNEVAMKFDESVLSTMHEGYWYELNFSFSQVRVGQEQVVSCPGETYIIFKVVPEYLTWNSTPANKYNANWNNDLNWLRSTARQLYKADYTDYGTSTYNANPVNTALSRQQAYTPMKFSKVTIDDQTGKVYPMLGNITYRSANDIATKLTNTKGEDATTNIAYDLSVKWNYSSADHSDNGDGTFSCETFHGNVCDEIYFKPHTELLNQCYLVYNKAYVEKELLTNKWYIASSPLRDTYAGDMYVPKDGGRQETEAFKPVTFDKLLNSRTAYPFYQRRWDSHAQEVVDGLTFYEAYDFNGSNFRLDTISDNSLNIESLYWSHVYNKMDDAYSNGSAFSIKAGDNYHHAADGTTWLLRLPKEDTQYSYFDSDDSETAVTAKVAKEGCYRMIVDPATDDNAYSPIVQALHANVHSDNGYFLVGNPYTASLSVAQFLKGNPSFAKKVWTMEGGTLTAHVISSSDNSPGKEQDVIIEPMQAFFVKLEEGATATNALFSTQMTVDRWIKGGATQKAPDGSLTINADNGERQSMAKVVGDDCADNGFADNEDAEMLQTTNLDDVPQVYTVAGSEAVQHNTLHDISWLPMGVVAKGDERVTLTFSATGNMKNGLFLFDDSTKVFTPISNGMAATIEANAHGRYFITTSSTLPSDAATTATIRCYSPASLTLTVCSEASDIASVAVYNTEGAVVANRNDINAKSLNITLQRGGIYVVSVLTGNGQKSIIKTMVRQQ